MTATALDCEAEIQFPVAHLAMSRDPRTVDEVELVERFRKSGDNRYFEELYRASRRKIYSICLHYLRDPQRAEDACSDTYVQAYERFDMLRGTNFTAWVRRIASNLCLNRLRHHGVRERLEPMLAGEEVVRGGQDRQLIARQQLSVAAHVVRGLPREQRQVFLLRYAHELSHREIESRTGYTSEQVRAYLQSSRRNFRRGFAERTDAGARDDHG